MPGIVTIFVSLTGPLAESAEIYTDVSESIPAGGRVIDDVDGMKTLARVHTGISLTTIMLTRFSVPLQRALLNASSSGVAIVTSQEIVAPEKPGICTNNSSPGDNGIITVIRSITDEVMPGTGFPNSSDVFQNAPNG